MDRCGLTSTMLAVYGILVLIASSFCAPGHGQATEGQPAYTLKLNSQLVQLDVVVRNAKGELVHGLTRNDFTVLENEVQQTIVAFDTTTSDAVQKARVAGIDSTVELDKRAPEAPVTIIVLDEISTRFEDEYFARYSVGKYLNKQGDVLDQPTMLIARTVDRTMVLSDYTTSKKKILDALNHHFVGNDWRANNVGFNDALTAAAFASLLEVAKATQGHAGHKNLIWIGRGFPNLQWAALQPDQAQGLQTAVDSCVDLLRQARITLYAIDPAGVQGASATSDENGVVSLDGPFEHSASFDSLAQATGGTSMHGRNDVDRLVEDAVANGESFYTLAYRPGLPEPGAPAQADPTKYRAIRVVLKDTTLSAISRQGYYPAGGQPVLAADAKDNADSSLMELSSASSGLMVFDGVPLTLQRPDPPSNQVQISFPASALGLALTDGQMKGDVTLIALGYDASGKLLDRDGRVLSLHLAALKDGQIEQRQVHLQTRLNLSLPIARVRVVVRSHVNNKIGADNLYLTGRNLLKDPATGTKPH